MQAFQVPLPEFSSRYIMELIEIEEKARRLVVQAAFKSVSFQMSGREIQSIREFLRDRP